MKRNLFSALALMTLALIGCHNNQEVAENDMCDSTINQFCPEGYTHLYAFQDAAQQMPTELFLGTDDELLAKLLPNGYADASVNTFLLCCEERNILFDAGLGPRANGKLMHNLDSIGMAPSAITDICITHLHFDHIGGLVDTNFQAAFPQATLHIAQAEYDAWTSGPLSSDQGMLPMVLKAYDGRIQLFGSQDTVLPGVVAIPAPGHTPGHTLYDLGTIIIAGDILHAVALQVEHPEFSARFDFDHAMASQCRKSILDKRLPMAGMHFPAPHFITFE